MSQILVTGYGGFLGAEISRQLVGAGFQVRGVARGVYPELREIGVECIQGDICDRDLVLEVTKGCDGVVNTAAKAGVWGPWQDYYRVNTLATSHLLEASHRNGIRAFVQTSSPSVTFEGEHQSGVDESVPYPTKWLCHYPHTKALAEQAVLESSAGGRVATCALRPHLIWGQGDPHLFPRVIERALQGRLRRVGSGKNLIDVVHVKSAASAHVAAMQRLLEQDTELNGQALFLTDGAPIECWEWISKILSAAGVPIPSRSLSFNAAYRIGAMLEAGYSTFRIKSEPPMTRFVAAQLALDHYFSIDRARQLLDYRPEVDVEAEFQRCGPWLRDVASKAKG